MEMKRRELLQLTTGLVVPVLSSSCGYADQHFEWSEDVLLSDGETITVKRTASLSPNYIAGGGGGSMVNEMSLQVLAHGPTPSTGKWVDTFVPLLLDRDTKTNEWYLVATFFHCESWEKLGRPKLPYTEYRHINGAWKRRDLAMEHIGRKANLYVADRKPKSQHMAATYKEGSTDPTVSKEYRFIVDKWNSTC